MIYSTYVLVYLTKIKPFRSDQRKENFSNRMSDLKFHLNGFIKKKKKKKKKKQS